MDLSKLSPAPWIDDGDGTVMYRPSPNTSVELADCTWGRVTEMSVMANSKFIALARNAHEIRQTRKWYGEYADVSRFAGECVMGWRLHRDCVQRMKEAIGVRGCDFQDWWRWRGFVCEEIAIVESDKWYRENVEGKQ